MNRNYLMAIKVKTDDGTLLEGNQPFHTDEPLTFRHIEIAKGMYCSGATKKGFKCSPENATVYAVIPLDV